MPIENQRLVQLGDGPCDPLQGIGGDNLCNAAQWTTVVHGFVDGLEQLVVFDDCLQAVKFGFWSGNPRALGNQNQTAQRWFQGKAKPRGERHRPRIEETFEHQHVPIVLLDGGRHSIGFAAKKTDELPLFIDGHAFREMFALAHPHVEPPIDEQMINLGKQTLVLDAQVVQNHPVFAVLVMHFHLVGGLLLAFDAGLNVAYFSFDACFRIRVGLGMVQQALEDNDVVLLAVGVFDDHGWVRLKFGTKLP